MTKESQQKIPDGFRSDSIQVRKTNDVRARRDSSRRREQHTMNGKGY